MSIERYVFKKKFVNLKYKYGNRHFWCTEFYVNIVRRNKKLLKSKKSTERRHDVRANKYKRIYTYFSKSSK
ncbi:hypothetical protein C1147_08535 [Clostridium botulinum]|nr:hypothetical protein C1147_08535 [Clostridium botulinum]